MNRGTEGRPGVRHIIFGALIGLGAFLAPLGAHAASLFVAPSTGQFGVGKTFSIVLRVNAAGQAVNAIEGVLTFNPSQLQVVSVTSPGTIFNMNVQDPQFSNSAGTVRWTGVILNPGYSGTSGNLITVTFRGIAQGTTKVEFTSAAVLANDGQGTNVLSGTSGGTYTVGPASTTSPAPSVAPTQVSAPGITSSTHPDPTKWYNSNDPQFSWTLPPTVDAVSYLVNETSDANPGNASDGKVSSASFTDQPDGSTYFHLKFRSGGAWGPASHFAFNTDTVPPVTFTVTRVDPQNTEEPRPKLAFSTTDATSGIASYRMRVDSGDWFDVQPPSPDSPFVMPTQSAGTHTVDVEAIDKAGNTTRASTTVTITAPPAPVVSKAARLPLFAWILVLIVLLILLRFLLALHGGWFAFLLRRREHSLVEELNHMLDDINTEIKHLDKAGRGRPLYPEEKYLRTKLMEYRRTLKFLVLNVREVEK